ncbi:MAG: FtsX-like permease family protein [Gemmatimonas sp.]|nr:FtsX-like permease family protein [Gemmatimonas sp.]
MGFSGRAGRRGASAPGDGPGGGTRSCPTPTGRGRTQVVETTRDARGIRSLERLAQDLRYGFRSLRRTPAFAATAVLILALGIGMSTAMFTVFRAVVLQELPVRDPDRIVTLWTYRDPTIPLALTPRQFVELRRESRALQDAAGVVHYGAPAAAVREGDRSLSLNEAMVTANFFEVLGARPVLGHLLRPQDGDEAMLLQPELGGRPAGREVAVISYRTWQRQFGGDPGVLGRRLTTTYNQVSYSIIGVAPPGLDYPVGADYWILLRPGDLVNVVARLAPNATPVAAQSEFLSTVQVLDRDRRDARYPTNATVQTMTQEVLGDARPVLVALTAAVALLLLIACVNVGNLLLLRASMRTREIVIRRTLGGTYGRVARLLFVESALLGAAGGALGLLIAQGLLRLLLALAPAQIPRMDMIRITGMPMGVAIGVTLLTVMLFGVLPALAAARGNLASGLRLDARSGTGTRRRRRVRQSLVVSQVALAVILLAGAGLLVRSLQQLERLDLGYDPEHLSIVELAISYVEYDTRAKLLAMPEELSRRLREVPGVEAVTPVLYRPFIGANLMQVTPVLEGQSEAQSDANAPLPLEVGGSEYFSTFRIPILRGRGFLDTDRRDAPSIVILSEAVARRFWPGQDPIGKRLRFLGSDRTDWRTVVGVAGDIRFRRLQEATPTIYVPWRQRATFGVFAVRTRDDLALLLPAIRSVVRDFDPQFDVWDARTMDDRLAGPLAQPRLSTMLLSGFALVALLLAAMGLYGVIATAVREQTRDLGVRMALGAAPELLRRDVLRGALGVTAAGVAVGLAGALVGSRLLASLLFEVSPTDPVTLVGVSVLLLVVALMAAYVPALRATQVDPMEALRAD